MNIYLLLALLVFGCAPSFRADAPDNGRRLVFEDDFDRAAIGSNWRWTFGNGRMYLSGNAIRLSHSSAVYCVVPLPSDDFEVEARVRLPTHSGGQPRERSITLALRSGEYGVGGRSEPFQVALFPEADRLGDPKSGHIAISYDRDYRVTLRIEDGFGSVLLDGETVHRKPVSPGQSEVNRYFVFSSQGLNGTPGTGEAVLDDFVIRTGPRALEKLPLRANTPEENRAATVKAADFIDPSNPAVGMQRAIDSLPASGGTVILPEGEFVMRRHLRLKSNMTLLGQGAGKTILRACKAESAAILKLETLPGQCLVSLSSNDVGTFMPGDGVCFDGNWDHPAGSGRVNKDCTVQAISGNVVTVSGTAPKQDAKTLSLWFPQIYANHEEFCEVKDLTIVSGEDGWGNFLSAAVNFGAIAGARVSRVHVARWRADGISLQCGSDAIVADNTVNNAQLGFHPGSHTQRFLWTRNLSLGNWSGLYFCYYNRSGVYHHGSLDDFTGLGWPFDIFNVIARNESHRGFAIEQAEGGGGVVFNNRFHRIVVGGGHEGSPTHDFLVAENRADSISFTNGLGVQRNMFAGNRNRAGDGPAAALTETPSNNFFAVEGAKLDLDRFPVGLERREPVAPPVLPEPVLDGAEFYRPGEPDAGFQAALNRLRENGGTLVLPAGRYALSQPLVLPPGVTLAGRGLGTVLHASGPECTNSLMVAEGVNGVAVRELVILGEYDRRAFRSPAILLKNANGAELIALDVRGWEGTAIRVVGGEVKIRDCRALGCAGNGFEFNGARIDCAANIARECRDGFVVARNIPGSVLEANIAGGNRGNGYRIEGGRELFLYTNHSGFNDGDGISLIETERTDVIANMLSNNNYANADGCGIRLGKETRNCRVYYNNVQDTQTGTQTEAIREDASAGGNRIRFNLMRTLSAKLASSTAVSRKPPPRLARTLALHIRPVLHPKWRASVLASRS